MVGPQKLRYCHGHGHDHASDKHDAPNIHCFFLSVVMINDFNTPDRSRLIQDTHMYPRYKHTHLTSHICLHENELTDFDLLRASRSLVLVYIEPIYRDPCIGTIYPTLLGFEGIQGNYSLQ